MDEKICPVDIYIRVSTTEQAEQGYSVVEQERKLRAFCEAMGYQVHRAAIDPGFSGANLDRPGIQEVISDVKKGKVRRVIVWKLDRLSRSQRDTMALLEDVFLPAGVAFQSLEESFDTGTPIGRCMVGVLSAFAQMERETIKARTMMGKEAAVKSGRFIFPRVPFGYKRDPGPDGKNVLTPDPFESVIVKDIYQLYRQGLSLAAVWKRINAKYGHVIADGTIGQIIGNPVYKGCVRIHGQAMPGRHEAIVSEEDWEAANARMKTNRSFYPSSGLLTGIVYCGDCGARLGIKTQGRPGQTFYKRSYVCYSVSRSNKRMIARADCQNRQRYLEQELDAIVMKRVGELRTDPEAIREMLEEWELDDGQEEAAAISSELDQVEKQIKRILDLYQAGGLDLDEAKDRLNPLKDKQAALSDSLEEILANRPKAPPLEEIMESLKDFSSLMEGGSFEERRIAIHSLVDKVIVNNGEVTIKWSFECE